MDTVPLASRTFWSRVRVSAEDACWPWTGRPEKSVAGVFQGLPVHRVAFLLTSPDEAQKGVHPCRADAMCCNPAHLRSFEQLTEAQVRLIRRAVRTRKMTRHELAKTLGVSYRTVCDAARGDSHEDVVEATTGRRNAKVTDEALSRAFALLEMGETRGSVAALTGLREGCVAEIANGHQRYAQRREGLPEPEDVLPWCAEERERRVAQRLMELVEGDEPLVAASKLNRHAREGRPFLLRGSAWTKLKVEKVREALASADHASAS